MFSDSQAMPDHPSNDWRITAYVFGQLDGEELAKFEQLLKHDASLRSVVDATRELAGQLEAVAELEQTQEPRMSDRGQQTTMAAMLDRAAEPNGPASNGAASNGSVGHANENLVTRETTSSKRVRNALVSLVTLAASALVIAGVWYGTNGRSGNEMARDNRLPQDSSTEQGDVSTEESVSAAKHLHGQVNEGLATEETPNVSPTDPTAFTSGQKPSGNVERQAGAVSDEDPAGDYAVPSSNASDGLPAGGAGGGALEGEPFVGGDGGYPGGLPPALTVSESSLASGGYAGGSPPDAALPEGSKPGRDREPMLAGGYGLPDDTSNIRVTGDSLELGSAGPGGYGDGYGSGSQVEFEQLADNRGGYALPPSAGGMSGSGGVSGSGAPAGPGATPVGRGYGEAKQPASRPAVISSAASAPSPYFGGAVGGDRAAGGAANAFGDSESEYRFRRRSKELSRLSEVRRVRPNGDAYAPVEDNPFVPVSTNALSTFSIDVDTASYSKIRMLLNQYNQLPPAGAVRIEEMINYFRYEYPQPEDEAAPFSAAMELSTCPWNPSHNLARIAIQGRKVAVEERKVSNLVFLLDVSGSMSNQNKLPLVRQSLEMLVRKLGENDRIAIVVYAGAAGLVLDSTTADQKDVILGALGRLQAGGSTNGGQGIQLAYQLARDHFIPGGTNRVILCTDGDFNVGTTNTESLVSMVERQAKGGVFLTVLGFGTGNLNDAMLEQISGRGDGNYAFIDSLREARKVLVEQLTGTLVTIAKDVKIQVEFNPAKVDSYRLIGYENRKLAAKDFADDTKDAGEIGAGHSVTALYEIVPAGSRSSEDLELRYQPKEEAQETEEPGPSNPYPDELLILKLRYKQPEGGASKLLEFPIRDVDRDFGKASEDFRFAAAVAGFGMLLRQSPHLGNATFASVRAMAADALGEDADGLRTEMLQLIDAAGRLRGEAIEASPYYDPGNDPYRGNPQGGYPGGPGN